MTIDGPVIDPDGAGEITEADGFRPLGLEAFQRRSEQRSGEIAVSELLARVSPACSHS
jgi:hypothetical protein